MKILRLMIALLVMVSVSALAEQYAGKITAIDTDSVTISSKRYDFDKGTRVFLGSNRVKAQRASLDVGMSVQYDVGAAADGRLTITQIVVTGPSSALREALQYIP